jgi:Mg/Co/Ni transporter MgtE
MTPAQIADILEILPRVDAEALRKLLPAQVEGIVHELLKFHDVELPSIATSRYLALPETATVGQALAKFRSRTQRYDVVMYVYIITPEGTLKGVIDIRELIKAEPEEALGIIMTEQIVTLSRNDSLADAASEFTKYGFRALPMVDEERKLVGAVRYKDLLSVMQ